MTAIHIYLVAVVFFAGAVEINGTNDQGRLLTPEEGCGFQPQNETFLMLYHHSWPWIGSLVIKSFLTVSPTNCTATLITSRHGITSAQCSNDLPLFLRLGETPKDRTTPFSDYVVAQFYAHPEAKPTELKNNIAILFLAEDVEFSDRIRPACLPPKPILKKRASEIYRLVRENPSDVSTAAVYKARNCTYVEIAMCGLFHVTPLWNQNAFCAYDDNKSGNLGDPLIVAVMGEKWMTPIYQIGLDALNAHHYPGVFLDLQPYVQWINDTISGNTQ